MTVQSEIAKVMYNGNGSSTVFSTVFAFFNNVDVNVVLTNASNIETLLTINTHYTLTGGNGNVGNVIMITPPTNTERLTIFRNPALTQNTDFINNDPFDAETLEKALDILTHIVQFLNERTDRGIRLPISSIESAVLTPEANKVIGFNSKGTGLQNYLPSASFAQISGVTTIAQLRTVEPTIEGQVIALVGKTVTGYGGGLYRGDLTDKTSVDNDNNIVVTAGGNRWKKCVDDIRVSGIRALSISNNIADAFVRLRFIWGNSVDAAGTDLAFFSFQNNKLTIENAVASSEIEIKSKANVITILDADSTVSGNAINEIRNGAGTSLFSVDESGVVKSLGKTINAFTRASCSVSSAGTITASEGVVSCTKTATGTYRIVISESAVNPYFTQAIVGRGFGVTSNINVTTTDVTTYNASNTVADMAFLFEVYY